MFLGLTLGCPLWNQRKERAGHPSKSSSRSPTSPPQEYRYVVTLSTDVWYSIDGLAGSISEDYREEWLPGPALGQIHHSKWRYLLPHTLVTCSLMTSFLPPQTTSCGPHELYLTSLACFVLVAAENYIQRILI